jgi:hypothetical protein
VRNDLRKTAAEMVRLKDVLKDSANIHPGSLVGVKPDWTIPEIQRPDVVQPEYMIDVAMCNQYRIQPTQSVSQSLLPEIRRGVDQYSLSTMLDYYRDTKPLVPGVGGPAGLAFTSD